MVLTVKKARLLSGLTQKDVADSLGVHVHTYMKWEKKPEQMSIRTAKELSKIVSIEMDDIFFEIESN
ncbi:helix-turn-helix domain-containing protein [Paenibacillus polymyxa]|uniref:helix-turn-helix transcriptional regulator n=1 Tax=Paenibacillus polymyxa TaxID=1406 RepID=UPI0008FAF134|nr:helix-turn-helix domain-containing protein [Paenibacillus polymyxa]APB77436.1 helix-turn-helix domain-containing protein [Paenibacillus polymyxa]